MPRQDTLYATLEISPRASALVIKAAYRCLAQHHHPDKNFGTAMAGERLAGINHAYSVLSDPVTRLSYDRKIGLQDGANERRGACMNTDGNLGSVVAGPHVSRPFGFRPLR
jgi:DnaJ-class molecular chaperone